MFYHELSLKMHTDFHDVFESNSTEHKYLGIVVPQAAAISMWQNQTLNRIKALNLKWWTWYETNYGISTNTPKKLHWFKSHKRLWKRKKSRIHGRNVLSLEWWFLNYSSQCLNQLQTNVINCWNHHYHQYCWVIILITIVATNFNIIITIVATNFNIFMITMITQGIALPFLYLTCTHKLTIMKHNEAWWNKPVINKNIFLFIASTFCVRHTDEKTGKIWRLFQFTYSLINEWSRSSFADALFFASGSKHLFIRTKAVCTHPFLDMSFTIKYNYT